MGEKNSRKIEGVNEGIILLTEIVASWYVIESSGTLDPIIVVACNRAHNCG